MTAFIVVVASGAVIFGLRSSLVMVFGERTVPAGVRRASGYVLPAMMSALAAGALVPAKGGLPDPRLVIVAVVGVLASLRFRSIAWPFLAGLAAYGLISLAPM
jgi:branched-subunit amino acid transport protein